MSSYSKMSSASASLLWSISHFICIDLKDNLNTHKIVSPTKWNNYWRNEWHNGNVGMMWNSVQCNLFIHAFWYYFFSFNQQMFCCVGFFADFFGFLIHIYYINNWTDGALEEICKKTCSHSFEYAFWLTLLWNKKKSNFQLAQRRKKWIGMKPSRVESIQVKSWQRDTAILYFRFIFRRTSQRFTRTTSIYIKLHIIVSRSDDNVNNYNK